MSKSRPGHALCISAGRSRQRHCASRTGAHREVAMKIRPLGDRIVVQRVEQEERTAGGILLPDTARKKPQKGKVLAVGPGKMLKDGSRKPLQVKEGDVVYF